MNRTEEFPGARGVTWWIRESPAELLRDQWREEEGFFEDSRLQIVVDWGERSRGRVVSGLTSLTPVTATKRVDVYEVDLGSFVGRVRFSLQSEGGEMITSVEKKVRRRKLGTDEDLAILERHWSQLHFPVDASTIRRVFDRMGLTTGATDLPQWTMLMRELIRPLLAATQSINSRPKHSLREERSPIPARSLRRPIVSSVLAAMKGQQRLETTVPSWRPDRGAEAMAARSARGILRRVQALEEEFEESEIELDPKLSRLLERLKRRLRDLARKGDTSEAHRLRQAVLHDARYRLLHQAALLARRSVTTEPGWLRAFRPPTAQLYEEWCAWAVAEELSGGEGREAILANLAQPWTQRVVDFRREGLDAKLFVQYEIAFLGWKHVPDLVLRLVTPRTVVLMDVKYRGQGDGLVEVPQDAINELHRYRDTYILGHPDAVHKEIWAAILHPAPAWNDSEWGRSHTYEAARNPAYRIGTVPLSPSLKEPLRIYLESALGDQERRLEDASLARVS